MVGSCGLHVLLADDGHHHLARELGLGRGVDGGRVVAHELELALRVVRRAGVLGDLLHALLDQVEHLEREGAHRALQLAAVGDDVGGLAGMDHGDRDDAGVDRLLVAADDGLEGLHHLAGDGHRVDAVVRHGAAWLPLPRIVILNSLDEAITGPG
jgi:hypothetical protein